MCGRKLVAIKEVLLCCTSVNHEGTPPVSLVSEGLWSIVSTCFMTAWPFETSPRSAASPIFPADLLLSQEGRWSRPGRASWLRRTGRGVACCCSPRSARWSCSSLRPAPRTWRFSATCFTACWAQCMPTTAMLLCSTTRSARILLPLCPNCHL